MTQIPSGPESEQPFQVLCMRTTSDRFHAQEMRASRPPECGVTTEGALTRQPFLRLTFKQWALPQNRSRSAANKFTLCEAFNAV